uniref:Uncharacterized protein n=1 Tax=Anguilla anguilla TaxID=7936 RepID=A0A0E9QEG2_ANGAN
MHWLIGRNTPWTVHWYIAGPQKFIKKYKNENLQVSRYYMF